MPNDHPNVVYILHDSLSIFFDFTLFCLLDKKFVCGCSCAPKLSEPLSQSVLCCIDFLGSQKSPESVSLEWSVALRTSWQLLSSKFTASSHQRIPTEPQSCHHCSPLTLHPSKFTQTSFHSKEDNFLDHHSGCPLQLRGVTLGSSIPALKTFPKTQ